MEPIRIPPAERSAGFTLIEIMVVVVILGLLATLVANSVQDTAETARETKAATDLRSIADAVRHYHAQHGHLPTLEQLTEPDDKGRRFVDELPPDPWGTEYSLLAGAAPKDFTVVSAGPNRAFGDADDLVAGRGPR